MNCKFCGNSLPDGARFCGKCGKSLVATPVEKKKGSAGTIVAAILAFVIILLLIGVIIFFLFKLDFFGESSSKDNDKEIEEIDDTDGDEKGDEDSDGMIATENTPVPALTPEPAEPEVTPEPAEPEVTPEPTPEPTSTPQVSQIHTYQLVIEDVSWSDAIKRCWDMGGYLVNINDEEEYAYIQEYIASCGLTDVVWWLGGCRQDGSDVYTWIMKNGYMGEEALNFVSPFREYWLQGEPSFSGGGLAEQYMNMFYHESEGRYVWNDVPNDLLSVAPYYAGKIGYICEFDDANVSPSFAYMLPESSFRYLTEEDLAGFDADMCRIARNEIFARHGRRFADAGLQAYFDSCYWYNGTVEPENFNDAVLNEFEVYNRDFIVAYEKRMGYR